MDIGGSVALVTGANRGLGATFADALLERGAAKVYAAVRDVTSVTDGRLSIVRLDVTAPASIAEAARAARESHWSSTTPAWTPGRRRSATRRGCAGSWRSTTSAPSRS